MGDCFDGSCWIIHFVYTPGPTETFSKCTIYTSHQANVVST